MRTFWIVCLAAGLSLATFATARAADPRERLTIEVAVVNDANVPAETLHEAQVLAGQIYARMSIDIVWKDSKSPGSTPATSAAVRLAVIISPESRFGHRPEAMGFAFNRGTLAYVFYRRTQEFSQLGSIPIASTLGHVLAHELGHLLLPNRPHAPAGLMRSRWDRNPELLILRNRGLVLGFTSEEALSARRHASGMH